MLNLRRLGRSTSPASNFGAGMRHTRNGMLQPSTEECVVDVNAIDFFQYGFTFELGFPVECDFPNFSFAGWVQIYVISIVDFGRGSSDF